MNFVDSHLHLFNEYYSDIDEVIKRAKLNGVNYFINSGASKKEIPEIINLSEKYEEVYLTLGYHPSEESIISDSDIEELEKLLHHKKVIGVGEIGLDYHYPGTNKKGEEKLFRRQLELAQKLNLPVVIHSRDAVNDTINILKEYKVKGIIHCFSGSLETARTYINMGFYLGIGGVVTFKNSKLKDVLKELSLDNIVLETDSPYLSPFRGNKNEPSNIYYIAKFLAELYEKDILEVSSITTNNINKIFDLNL